MDSEMVYTGAQSVTLLQNEYKSGDDVLIRYRHGATAADCNAAAYGDYTVSFESLGFVQIRIVSTL